MDSPEYCTKMLRADAGVLEDETVSLKHSLADSANLGPTKPFKETKETSIPSVKDSMHEHKSQLDKFDKHPLEEPLTQLPNARRLPVKSRAEHVWGVFCEVFCHVRLQSVWNPRNYLSALMTLLGVLIFGYKAASV